MDGLPGELRKGPVGTDLIVCVFFFQVVSSVACLNDGIWYKYPGDHNLWVRDFFLFHLSIGDKRHEEVPFEARISSWEKAALNSASARCLVYFVTVSFYDRIANNSTPDPLPGVLVLIRKD